MDLNIKRRPTKYQVPSSLAVSYPHDLQLYRVPPTENIRLQEFETLAIERLKLLRIIASATTLKGHRMYSEQWNESIIADLKTDGLKYYAKLCEKSGCSTIEAELQARKKDHISHFILRLAYCRTEELRRWFVSRELELFKMRFLALRADSVDSFFEQNNLKYIHISSDEKNSIAQNLRESTHNPMVDSLKFYKVKFFEVFDLVKTRKVFLKDGFAYIPHTDLISVLLAQYRTHLKQSLAVASHHLGEIEHDERIVPLLKGIHNSYTGDDYNTNTKTVIPISSLDSLSVKSFPLCMRQLHEYLRLNHHLKHGGRMQYGLFLKAIGVTLEDSLIFWREEFTKIMDLDKFEKQYAYNIRHNYGKEGNKRNYSPYSCIKIIQTNIGPGDTHGCPFRHSDLGNLKNKLQGYGINGQDIQDILDKVKRGDYQVACSKYFDLIHHIQGEIGINHPNQFFEESQKVIQGIVTPSQLNQSSSNNENIKKENITDLEDINFDAEMTNAV